VGDLAIRVEGLSKQYHIGGPQQTYHRLGDQLADTIMSPFRRAGKLLRGQATGAAELDETVWALKDVTFEVKRGEMVGIIGLNGAGKSTLLKILSEITAPTEGYADVYGRVGTLLEVGTGFHPELTGRENIYLNGAILGMKKAEIARKFDEIVAFAEIGQFLDTPVKHYSSGMYVRLAFAVAAHLEPEILLVDEVLAVGDLAFQRKCLGKMDDVIRQGRTVLFVSHSLGIIQNLCERGILLQNGMIAIDDTMSEAINAYLQTLEQMSSVDLLERGDRRGQGKVRLVGLEITDDINGASSLLKIGGLARFVLHVNAILPDINCTVSFYDHIGQHITTFDSKVRSQDDVYGPKNSLMFVCELDELFLMPGRYRVDVALVGDNCVQDFVPAAAFFDVTEGTGRGRPTPRTESIRKKTFSVWMPHRWTLPCKG
jgi:lipopolysaccharide transport system ATP-binding protein